MDNSSQIGQISPDGGYRGDGHNWQQLAAGEVLDYFDDPHGATQDRVLRSYDHLHVTMTPPVVIPELVAMVPLSASGIREGGKQPHAPGGWSPGPARRQRRPRRVPRHAARLMHEPGEEPAADPIFEKAGTAQFIVSHIGNY
jgi:hypothetical protein